MVSSDLPRRLNSNAISAVIGSQNQVLDPKLLLDFFYWSSSQIGTPPNIDSFSNLAVRLCNCGLFPLANGLLERMIKAHPSPSSVLDSIIDCFKQCDNSNPAVFDVLIDTYKKMGLLKSAAEFVLLMKGGSFKPGLRCCNALLKDLLKANQMDLFWKINEFMIEERILQDVYTFTILIGAYFKAGDAWKAKKVFREMESMGCVPNAVTYNTLIDGLCRSGAIDDAFELKREMAEKGLVADVFTYGALINGLCKDRRSKEAKLLLSEMPGLGLNPGVIAYSTLIDGFMREGNVDEAFRIRDEMVASGIRPNILVYNNLVRGVCKMGKMDKAQELLKEMHSKG